MRLKRIIKEQSGRNSSGKLTVRHQGGRVKRFYREIDFKRNKLGVWGVVEKIEKDPNRNALLALVLYRDGERRYILAPLGLKEGMKVVSGPEAPIEVGNALPLSAIPAGSMIHNLELSVGKGGQIVKSAGSAATIQGSEADFVLIKLPSGEVRRVNPRCYATIGQVGNIEARNRRLGKAGLSRYLGIKPRVRGVAMHPNDHPHGGGEGRSSVGLKYPKTPWGRPAVGRTRKRKKYSDKLILSRRKRGKK